MTSQERIQFGSIIQANWHDSELEALEVEAAEMDLQ